MIHRPEQGEQLQGFIERHRDEIIFRSREKVASRASPPPVVDELVNGVPLFLTQLGFILDRNASAARDGEEMGMSARLHGADLLERGFSIAEVVHEYGDVCQAITELATDLRFPIGVADFQILNRCLDDSIADAVTEYARRRDAAASEADILRRGSLAHELRNHLNTATLAFEVVRSGLVGVSGSTVEVVERSLRTLRELIDRSTAEVRASRSSHRRHVRLAEFIDELATSAEVDADRRGMRFHVDRVNSRWMVDVDQHLLASAISNLLQNAFKFTRAGGHVCLRAQATDDQISIEVADECGGLPAGTADVIFQPFEQRGADRTGLGLGLAISRHAVEACGGTLSVRDLPGTGCVFTATIPRVPDEVSESPSAPEMPVLSR